MSTEFQGLTEFRCKCGRTRTVGFIQPPPCHGCRFCRTNLTPAGVLSWVRAQHDMYSDDYVITNDGQTIELFVCKMCGYISDRMGEFTTIT